MLSNEYIERRCPEAMRVWVSLHAPPPPPHTNESDFTESGPSMPEGRGQEMVHKGRGLLLFLAAQQGAACEISVPPPGIEPGAVKLLNPNQ